MINNKELKDEMGKLADKIISMMEVLENKADLYDRLCSLMGYIENGSSTTVTLFQDEVTKGYHIKVGQDSKITKAKYYWGFSMSEAIDNAVKNNPPEIQTYGN